MSQRWPDDDKWIESLKGKPVQKARSEWAEKVGPDSTPTKSWFTPWLFAIIPAVLLLTAILVWR